jgi:hypothetical protein
VNSHSSYYDTYTLDEITIASVNLMNDRNIRSYRGFEFNKRNGYINHFEKFKSYNHMDFNDTIILQLSSSSLQ